MSSITLKNIPRHLHLAYKRRAKKHSRSLQAEILHTLDLSVGEDPEEGSTDVDEVAGILKPKKHGVTLDDMDRAVDDMFREQWHKR